MNEWMSEWVSECVSDDDGVHDRDNDLMGGSMDEWSIDGMNEVIG